MWTPPRTPRVHVNGRWTPEAPLLTAWCSDERLVAHRYEDPEGLTVYVDVVRAVEVTPHLFAYTDLYVDVILKYDRVWSKDEQRLASARYAALDDVRIFPPGAEAELAR